MLLPGRGCQHQRWSRRPFPVPAAALAAGVLSAGALAACAPGEISAPPPRSGGDLVVDASRGWSYVSLTTGSMVTPADPGSATSWDIAFNATSVMLNGGQAGPGGVTGYCICQNATATSAELLAMTPESARPAFERVTAGDVPAQSAFQSEVLTPAISGWYTGSGASAVADSGKTWLVRLSDSVSFAKIRVLSLGAPSAQSAGTVRLQFAVQPSSAAPFGPVRELSASAAPATSIDLNTGTVTTSATDWDVRVDGWAIRVNGGASGTGKAAATPAPAGQSFGAVTTASVDARAYQTDRFAGVFAARPWYRYNLAGDRRVTPTFDVYLLRRGSTVYKLQITNYYGPAGEPRQITFRYARLQG